MVLRSSLVLVIALAGLLLNSNINEPDQAKKEFFTLQAVVNFMDRMHYEPKSLDDDLSHLVYNSYLEALDPAKRFLMQAEVEQLLVYKSDIDNEISAGSFKFFDASVLMIDNAILRAETLYKEVIDKEIDLHKGEPFLINSKDRGYAADEEALREYWRKLIKYEKIAKIHGLKRALAKTEEQKSESKLLDEAHEKIKKNFDEWFKRLKDLRRSDRFEDYLNAITNAYDPHSTYFSPQGKEEFDLRMNGSYEGIGARLKPEGEMTKVTEVIPGGPAWKQKQLGANDLIIKVAQEGEEAKDVRGWRQDDVIALIRGKKGTKVFLTVLKPDGSEQVIGIVRDRVVLEEGRAKSALISTKIEGTEVGYISLPKFYFETNGQPGCAEDVSTQVSKLKAEGAKGIILDLRNNGGGSLSEVVDMTGLFIDEGPVVQVKSREHRPYVLEDDDSSVEYQGPLMVLVNHFSASASEIIAAALQDYDRAIIVGSNSTFGKGTVQRFFPLDRHIRGNNHLKPLGEVKITTQKFYRVNGGSTQLKGVIPDIILPSPYNYIKTGEKELETPLAWSESEPVEHGYQNLPDRDQLAENSRKRVADHDGFGLIEERAHWLKKQEDDQLVYDLSLEGFTAQYEERKARNEKYKDMFETMDSLDVRNLDAELQYLSENETRKANNEEFLKSIGSDLYLEEAINIMQDMLQLQ